MPAASARASLDQKQDAWIAEIEADKRRRISVVCMLRLGEIKRILKDREINAPAMRNDPSYAQDVLLLFVNIASHLYGHDEGVSRVRRWCYFNCRWAADIIDAEAVDLFSTGFPFFAAKCAQMMRLTYADRVRLKIKTIRPCDVTWEQCQAMNREAVRESDRERKAAKRRAAGARENKQSLQRTKPWEAEGISRTEWYRRKRGTGSSADRCIGENLFEDETVPLVDEAIPPEASCMENSTRHGSVASEKDRSLDAAPSLEASDRGRVFSFRMRIAPSGLFKLGQSMRSKANG